MLAGIHKETYRIIPLVLAICVVVVGAYFVGTNTMTHMLRASAESDAQRWGAYMVRNTPNMEPVILGTDTFDSGTRSFLRRKKPISINHYRIYDQSGFMRWDSRTQNFISDAIANFSGHNQEAFDVLATGHNHFGIIENQHGENVTRTSHLMVPLVDGMRPIGVLEVIIDTTLQWNALRTQFQNLSIQVAGLLLLAFALPGFLYLRRSGQLEFTSRRLQRTAEYDELTGALNRTTFAKIMEHKLSTAADRGLSVAVHFIDLDRFKDVNDTRGHAIGDEVLQMAALRLRKLMGIRERFARLGGDEFAICQPYFLGSPQVVEELANDIVREMAKPFIIGNSSIQIGASVGYSYFPRDGKTVAELVRSADIALYKAKERNRGRAVAFDPSMETERQARQSIEIRLRQALAQGEFDIHFQPLYETNSRKLSGFEALLRMNDDEGEPISPEIFVPIAEDIGLIGEIGAWVLREACRTACEWPDGLMVCVNLSPAQFHSHKMPKLVKSILESTGLPARQLELEVTESLLIMDTEEVLRELMEIKSLGVSIALDDFGTGYSSLSYLWRFPFDKLKVDKSFINDLAVNGSKSREILSTIIALGKVLDLKITAEGVETEAQAKVLRDLDCDLVQGFLYGRPMKLIDVAATVMKSREKPVSTRTKKRRPAKRRA